MKLTSFSSHYQQVQQKEFPVPVIAQVGVHKDLLVMRPIVGGSILSSETSKSRSNLEESTADGADALNSLSDLTTPEFS